MGDIAINNLNDVRFQLPAIFTEHKAPDRSEAYKHANTADIVATLQRFGWEPMAVSGGRTRKPELAPYKAHGVRLSNAAFQGNGYERPQLVLRNAHDTSSAVIIKAGFYTFACANKTVVGASLAHVRILHRDYTPQRLLDGVSDLLKRLPQAMASLDAWRGIQLSPDECANYLGDALQLRWPIAEDPTRVVQAFGRARRAEDNGNSLYQVFQRAQESLVRGGVYVSKRRPEDGAQIVTRARPIGALDASIRINTGLWDLTEQTAKTIG